MDWKDFLKTMKDKHICAFCGLSLHDLSDDEVKKHLAQKHREEMLDVFRQMVQCHHYCPFHRGQGRHAVFVTCDQTRCPECGKDLTPYRVNFVAGFLAKMSV
jgi:uncharacterized protein with PIN domain